MDKNFTIFFRDIKNSSNYFLIDILTFLYYYSENKLECRYIHIETKIIIVIITITIRKARGENASKMDGALPQPSNSCTT